MAKIDESIIQMLYSDFYMDQYNKSLRVAGGAKYSPQMYHEFKQTFTDIIENRKKFNISSKLSYKQISRQLGSAEVYDKTTKQARAIKQAIQNRFREFNIPEEKIKDIANFKKIRRGEIPPEFWDFVKKEREKQIKSGKSSKKAQLWVSKYIFGSE